MPYSKMEAIRCVWKELIIVTNAPDDKIRVRFSYLDPVVFNIEMLGEFLHSQMKDIFLDEAGYQPIDDLCGSQKKRGTQRWLNVILKKELKPKDILWK